MYVVAVVCVCVSLLLFGGGGGGGGAKMRNLELWEANFIIIPL